MKLYLLTAGHVYSPPDSGTDGWIKTFETHEEAESVVKSIDHHTYFTKGKSKGEIKSTYNTYEIFDKHYDYYEIINLKDWIFK